MELDIIANAESSFNHLLSHVDGCSKGEVHDSKIVIRELIHIIELLFKERLRVEHDVFLYKSIDKINTKEPQTVGFDLAIQRLENIVKIRFNEEDKVTIGQCKKLRNNIEHYKFTFSKEQVMLFAGRLLYFVVLFSKNELNLEWESVLKENKNYDYLLSLPEYWENHVSSVMNEIESEGIEVIECAGCEYNSMSVETGLCLLCNFSDDITTCDSCDEQFCSSIMESIGYDSDFYLCPACYDDAMYAMHFD